MTGSGFGVRPLNLVKQIQAYVAVTSADATVLRGQPKGSVKAAAEFLSNLQLKRFGTANGAVFRKALDESTEGLRRAFPSDGQFWGVARKALNIFLHNAFYNHYLRSEYGLDRAEDHYEVPVDAAVAKGLRQGLKKGTLPCWEGVRYVKREQNDRYQERARLVAENRAVKRVHLDAVLWLEERES